MQGEFKQCPNGHYYQGDSCPYCRTGEQKGNATTLKTEVFIGIDDSQPTSVDSSQGDNFVGGQNKTMVAGQDTFVSGAQSPKVNYNRTVFGDEEVGAPVSGGQNGPKKEPRYGRKLVGWLVTYSIDELGADYKLYEGRNIIGRDLDCNITVNDNHMSGKHAVLLFRANKYSLTDSQSSHGTFVNDEDIELEPRYLRDGDIIRMGNTVFKFRTSL